MNIPNTESQFSNRRCGFIRFSFIIIVCQLPVGIDLWTVVAIANNTQWFYTWLAFSDAFPINWNIANFHLNTTIWPCDTQCRSNTTFNSSEKKRRKKKRKDYTDDGDSQSEFAERNVRNGNWTKRKAKQWLWTTSEK